MFRHYDRSLRRKMPRMATRPVPNNAMESVLHRRFQQSLTSSEESPCDGKARPKQNQARGLRRDVRLDENVIRYSASSVLPCDGTNQLRRSVLDGVASSRKKNRNDTRPQTVRLTQRIRTVGSKREGN